MLRLSLLFLPLLFFSKKNLWAQCPAANPVTVTNTNNVGGGSLNWAIGCINTTPALTTIEFNLPGATVITPTAAAPLPNITKANALIDGLSQPSGTVIIDGSSSTGNGLTVNAAGGNVSIRGLHIRDFTGTGGGTGIALFNGNGHTLSENRLTNNRVGISTATAITSFTITENILGLTAAGGASGNTAQGMNIASVPTAGVVLGNTIAHSGSAGINIAGGTVLISNNSIYCNLAGGIVRSGGPAAPVITSANTQRIRGTAAVGRVIQVFSHSITGCTAAPCQGKTLLGTVTTPASGIWQLDLAAGQITAGTAITATSTQASNNTSVFATCINSTNCANFVASVSINSNVSCFGGNNGIATASTTGGSPLGVPTYLWNTGATTATINNLTANTYTVTATDAAGCTATASGTVTQPTALSVSVSTTAISCFGGNNGTATANPTGGTAGAAGYTYLWSNGQTSKTATNLSANTYTVTVTDAAGCTATASGTVTQPATLAATVSTTPVSCFGGNNGTATVNPSGGTPGSTGYTYLWSNGQTAQTATALSAGAYVVTVTDANGCSIVRTATVAQPAVLAATISTTPATCFGQNNGTATANPTGGTSGSTGYTYLWSNGQTTKTATALAAATYTVTVTDANGCTVTASGSVSQPIALVATVNTTSATCFGQNNGTATATATGGTPGGPGYTYLWSNGQNGPTAFNLAAGAYTVTVTDVAECTATASGTVSQPAAVSVSVSTIPADCFGENTGGATATVSGGTPGSTGYQYTWNTGGTTATLINLPAGIYTTTVTDAVGCTGIGSGTVAQPPLLVTTVSTTPATCFGGNNGTATANPTGGTPNYTYLWSNGQTTKTATNLSAGTVTVTVTDANGCSTVRTGTVGQPTALTTTVSTTAASCFGGNNGTATANPTGGTPGGPGYTYLWSNGQTTKTATALSAATYTVTVTDANGCTVTTSGSVSQPTALGLSLSSTNETAVGANDGTATATASGGTPTLLYLWSNGQTVPTIMGLAPGVYTLTVTDANGCTISDFVSISPFQCAGLSLNVTATNVTCNGAANGTATAVPSGSSGYTFVWNTGATSASIANLAPGNYTATVTDVAGCTAVDGASVSQPPAINLVANSSNVTCNGASNGTASAAATGGTPSFSYTWSNGASGQNLTGLPPGTYTITATDAAGCTATAVVSISQPAALSVSVSTTGATCFGQNNGTATATATGGTPGGTGYTYLWSNGQTAATATALGAATYTVTVTDAAGCTATASGTVSQPTALALSLSSTNETAVGANNGTATATASGGTPTLLYLWSNGQTTPAITGLPPGVYTVTVSDANGCSISDFVSINSFQCAGLSLAVSSTNVTCFGAANGTVTAVPSGSSGYVFLWNTGAATASVANLPPGNYTVTVNDAAGCTVVGGASVSQPPAISLVASSSNITCNGASNGTASAAATGGTPSFSYTWSNGASGQNLTGLPPGTYTVTATDSASCTASQTLSIAQPPALTLSVTKTDETAVGAKDGTATATAGGGTAPLNLLWSNGATTPSIMNLSPGTYTVTLSDANGCTRTTSASIAAFGCGGVSVGISKTDVTCNGASNATATANPTGGTAPFTYLWSNGQTAQTATALAPNTYTVTATDAAGCTASQTASIAQPPALTLSVTKTDETAVNAKDGTATATAGGGSPPLSLLWNNGAIPNAFGTITNLAPGTYTVTLSDANGCTRTASASIAAGSGSGGGGCKSQPVYAVLAPSKVCGNQPFILEADDLSPHAAVRYVWHFPNGDSAISVKTAISVMPTSTAFSGEYFVLRDSAGCRSKSVGGAPVSVTSLAPGTLQAGNDTLICSSGVVVLKAAAPPAGLTAAWLSLGSAKVDNPALPLTSARNLAPGPNLFLWKTDLPGCPAAASDTVTFFLEVPPLANDDRYTLQRASDVAVMEVLLNDNLIGLADTIVYQLNSPSVGTLEYLDAERRFRYTVEEGYRGTVTFRYAVCPESASICGFDCDTATVTIEVLNLPKVPEGLLLNDPGPNGRLTIKGLSLETRLEISIFNRWGDLVFSSKNYGAEKPWEGDFNGKKLPEGAYYYQLRVFEAGKPLGGLLKGVVHLFEGGG